jgi:hypothetical protein
MTNKSFDSETRKAMPRLNRIRISVPWQLFEAPKGTAKVGLLEKGVSVQATSVNGGTSRFSNMRTLGGH